MPSSKLHTAPGQMAGYLFQPERALLWLAKSQRGAKVGIETEDDIVQVAKNGTIHREQNKHSVSRKGHPFGDTSKDLWNTLDIWLRAVESEDTDINKTSFYLVTNKIVPDCLARRLGEADSEGKALSCLSEMRKIRQKPPRGISPLVSSVLSIKHEVILTLIKSIHVVDASDRSHGSALREEISSYLHIPSRLPANEIIRSLSGWMHQEILDMWREGLPAWLTREAFDNQLFRVTRLFKDRAFVERAKALIPITTSDRKAQLERLFVEQLRLISVPRDDLVEAIDDFIRCCSETTRLSREGNLTSQDFEAFAERLCDRWRLIMNRHKRGLSKPKDSDSSYEQAAVDCGQAVLTDSLDHRETLAGRQTEEYYLTRGYYHRLADSLDVGWHPDFKHLLKRLVE